MASWKSIVCGVDSGRGCVEAVRAAARIAREQSATLVLLHVVKRATGEALLAPGAIAAAREEQAARWSGLASDLRGEPVPLEAMAGEPADGILEYARKGGCDLIVLGSHARSRASLALTSLVLEVLAHAPCQVLIVPPGTEDLQSDFPGQVA